MKLNNKTESGIYCIENLVNGKYYIGSSSSLRLRKNQHFSDLRNRRHTNSYLQNAFNKHGEKNFKFYVLEFCEVDRRLPREQKWLDMFNNENCYNMCPIAAAPNLGKNGHSEETVEKMRQRMSNPKANPMSNPEYRKKISDKLRMFDDETSKKFCDEFMNSEIFIKDMAEREGCSETAIIRAINRFSNNYISGTLTKEEHRHKSEQKRFCYRLPYYKEIYEEYMTTDKSAEQIGEERNLGASSIRHIIRCFKNGNKLYDLEPDDTYKERIVKKNEMIRIKKGGFNDEFYLKLLYEYNSGKGSIQYLADKYGCYKSWIRVARKIKSKTNE